MELLHADKISSRRFIRIHVISLVILSIIHFHLTTTVVVEALGNETDRIALLKFKEAITADPDGSLNSWNDSVHFCQWQGVTCATMHQRVEVLKLQQLHLHGTISPYIGNFSFLRFFNLKNNSFSGRIPRKIVRLSRLQHLNLSYNMLEGEMPTNLSFFSQLVILSFGSNRLTGRVSSELGLLVKLVFLNLEKNNLTGGIPPTIGNLSSLTGLSFAYNNLVGNIPKEIGRLRNLSFISITANKLSGTIPPHLFNISSMQTFSLSGNEFNGTIPSGIGLNMPNLQTLYLGGNNFSGHIPASLSNASKLRDLDIMLNKLSGKVPAIFGNLQNLEMIALAGNSLESYSANDWEFITALTNCSKLNSLDMSRNMFGGVLPNSIANFSTNFTFFDLRYNQISGPLPETLTILENLIILRLEDNLFTGAIPASFGKFQKLQQLSVFRNRLSGSIPSSIGNLTQLFELYLWGNELEGSIPSSIGNCQSLQHMELSWNKLSGDIPPQVVGISSLLYLNLSFNSLTGELPVEVTKLENIISLDISENNLTGEIPEAIGNCFSLQTLSLQGNLIRGIIPSFLASLKDLHYIDLSRNNLSGQIPSDLQKNHFLLYLNLSFNSLEGEVPKGGVFRNTSAISLVGNTKLCGGVPDLQLPTCHNKVPKQAKMHGFKMKLVICLGVGCSLLCAFSCALYWRRRLSKKPLATVASIDLLSKVSYQTLHQATNGFSPRNLIGSGGFGTVYKGILDEEENKKVAIKVLNLQQKGASKSFMAECNALRNIRHRNLVKNLTCCSSIDHSGNDFKALVFEYMSNGSLEEWLHRENQSRSLSLIQRLNIIVDVASALCYLHDNCEPQIIHCDVKPSNVLLDDEMVAHVGDFGLARLVPTIIDSSHNQSSTIGIRGTIGYAAPEYASGVEVSRQGDVYSYGVLVLEMFTGRRPTDELFVEGLNLHNFVKMAIPTGRLLQIVDPTLVATLEEMAPATTENEVNFHNGNNIGTDAEEDIIDYENLGGMNFYVWKCILPILKIGLSCSEESPRNRMSMEDVTKNLNRIKNAYDGLQTRRDRPRRN